MANRFDFSQSLVLENEYVMLRPLEPEDSIHLLPFIYQDQEVWQYGSYTMRDEKDVEKFIKKALEARQREKEYPFIVFDKQKQKYAGSTRFYEINLLFKTLHIGYTWYGKPFQGTGLNKECKFLLLEFAFENMQMERVEFRIHPDNERSIAAVRSIGGIVEGRLRQDIPLPNGKRRDSMVLGILKSEWEGETKQKLWDKIQLIRK